MLVIFVQQTHLLRFQIFHSTKFTNGAHGHVISHLSLFFATSTSGRFVKLKSSVKISKYKSVQNLIKQLFHSRLLDMRLVIANSAYGLVGYLPSHIQRALME